MDVRVPWSCLQDRFTFVMEMYVWENIPFIWIIPSWLCDNMSGNDSRNMLETTLIPEVSSCSLVIGITVPVVLMWSYISSGRPACVLQSSAQMCKSDCGVGDKWIGTKLTLPYVFCRRVRSLLPQHKCTGNYNTMKTAHHRNDVPISSRLWEEPIGHWCGCLS